MAGEAQKFKRVGVVFNTKIPLARDKARKIERANSGTDILVSETIDDFAAQLDTVDLVIAIGGDGTILRVVQQTAAYGVPVLGINAGTIGFLMEYEIGAVSDDLRELLSTDFYVEERQMLRINLTRGDGAKETRLALNEAYLSRGGYVKAIKVDVKLDGEHFQTYDGDGVLVATATGSTAYAMSLSTPIQLPTLSNFVIKPVGAIPPFTESLIVDSATEIKLRSLSRQTVQIVADGVWNMSVSKADDIAISGADVRAKFLRQQHATGADGAAGRWSYLANKLREAKRKRLES